LTDFFGKKGCHVFSNFELFQFVTDKYLLSALGVPPAGEGVPALLVKAQECLDASTARREEEDLACEAEAAARATSDAATAGNGDTSTNAAAAGVGAAAARSEEARIEEAVFLQSYIPSSLNEISNPMQEMARLQTGQREPVYASAVRGMLADSAVGGVGKDGEKDRERKPVHVLLRPAAAEGSTAAAAAKVPAGAGAVAGEDGSTESEEGGAGEEGSDDSDDSDGSDDSDDSDGSDDDDGEEDGAEGAPRERKKKSSKYRRQLPGHADPAERQAEKEARKEARKKAKEEAAKKRTEKIPKHVKKRAMKAGKKKK